VFIAEHLQELFETTALRSQDLLICLAASLLAPGIMSLAKSLGDKFSLRRN